MLIPLLALAAFASTAAPDRVLVRLLANSCHPTLNGRSVTLRQLEVAAHGWRRTRPAVRFQPDRQSSFGCVDTVLAIFKRQRVARLDVIGAKAAPDARR
ncbi:hypothetical protein [Sphingomonas bacterium]|uniref:hypothetical protein n=1 Tax=Sphingomonas bacterium TaxID=1895847 RepID=UPI0015756E56|nr:hypothetical protein [Sphingomonas bacterium]